MAVFKRAPTWGEGKYLNSWGRPNSMWVGRFLDASEMTFLGVVQADSAPTADIYGITYPSVDIQATIAPTGDAQGV